MDALLGQSLQNIEVILVDDGSTDDSRDICLAYQSQDSRIKFASQVNSGPATARNKGLALAQGEYVMFCDADDWYEPRMCEEMLCVLESEGVDCVMCGIQIEDEACALDRGKEELSYYQVPCVGKFDLEDFLRMRINVCSVNKIFKKSLMEQYHIVFPDGFYNHEDDAFIFQYLGVATNIFFINEPLYHYFRRSMSLHGQQMTGRNLGQTKRIDIVRVCYAWMMDQDLWERLQWYFLEVYRLEFSQCYKDLYDEQIPTLMEEGTLFCRSLAVDWHKIMNRHTRVFFGCLLRGESVLLERIVYGVREGKIAKYKFLSLLSCGKMRNKYQAKYLSEESKRRRSMPMP